MMFPTKPNLQIFRKKDPTAINMVDGLSFQKHSKNQNLNILFQINYFLNSETSS